LSRAKVPGASFFQRRRFQSFDHGERGPCLVAARVGGSDALSKRPGGGRCLLHGSTQVRAGDPAAPVTVPAGEPRDEHGRDRRLRVPHRRVLHRGDAAEQQPLRDLGARRGIRERRAAPGRGQQAGGLLGPPVGRQR
jgi:hypothetical protein